MPREIAPDHPDRVGPYRILQALGEGGMGTVYEAEQLEPVRRRVALKLIRAGMASPDTVARFEAERQALALMSHPGIARVLDGGLTDDGRPYFVMELVKGIPFTEYCDQQTLPLRDRIALFIKVVHAVQHAHQKGVIHRDLKPSNVLVAEHEGELAVKIIDFGIAKATAQPLTDKTLVTAYGMALGTLAYMSPEQAEFSNLDIDTRSDVYSLGVMLFEVLVGELPVDPGDLGAVPFLAQLVARVSEPERPSTRMTTTAKARRQARLRGADSGQLRKLLRGDLDWIVVKATEKERNRRYDTASALAADLERFLRNEPVLARSPSALYRFGKFARRNRVGVAAAGIVLTALVGAVVVTSAALDRARRDAETATQVSDFMTGLFAVSDPSEARGNSITARELLDSAAVRIQHELADQPLVRARLMLTIGKVYSSLGLPAPAEPVLDSALAIRERMLGPDSPDVAEVLVTRAQVFNTRGNDSMGVVLASRAVAIYEAAHGPDALEVASALEAMSFYLGSEEYATKMERVLAIRGRHLDADDPLLAQTHVGVGWGMQFRNEVDSAAQAHQRALRILTATDHPSQVDALEGLAAALSARGDLDAALARYEEAIRVNSRFHERNAPQSVGLLTNKAVTLGRMGRLAEAETTILETVRRTIERLGPEAVNLDWQLGMLGTSQMRQHKWVEAAATAGRQADLWEARGGRWAANVPRTRAGQARTLVAAGQLDRARAILIPIMASFGGEPPEWAASVYHTMAVIESRRGSMATAGAHYARAIDGLTTSRGTYLSSVELGGLYRPRPLVLAELFAGAAAVERRLGRVTEAEALMARAGAAREDLLAIGIGYRDLQHADTALTFLQRAAERGMAALPGDDQPLSAALTEIARTQATSGDREGAADTYTRLVALAESSQPASRPAAQKAGVLISRLARHGAALRRVDSGAERDQGEHIGVVIDSIIGSGALSGDASPAALNTVCWWGALAGHGRRVMTACDAAVEATDGAERGRILESRAVARATAGDLEGAAQDIEGYLASLDDPNLDQRRQRWLTDLRAGRNPYTRAVLDRMILS